ncbi:hypothetical protein [Cryptosporangium sp. NPDC051539]|uniref:hypothetical protein n=1 Tax=Cryptosporangium sp. NPDC051539 TaxID=3363962 RepID=UPI0037966F3E
MITKRKRWLAAGLAAVAGVLAAGGLAAPADASMSTCTAAFNLRVPSGTPTSIQKIDGTNGANGSMSFFVPSASVATPYVMLCNEGGDFLFYDWYVDSFVDNKPEYLLRAGSVNIGAQKLERARIGGAATYRLEIQPSTHTTNKTYFAVGALVG